MDAVDLTLIARLSREPLAPVSALAEAAGLTPNAVRARLARLREQGVLMGAFAFPNPALFGRVARIAVYAPPARAVKPRDILAVDDVISYSVNHDGQIAVTYHARSRVEPPDAKLDRLMGAPAPRTYVREAPPLVPPGAALSAAQWAIVEAMVEDARATNRALGEAAGMSERAAARHKEKLLAGNHVTLVTGILSNLAEGIVLYHLYAAGNGTLDEARVMKACGGVVQERTRDPDGLYLFCHGAALGDALLARDRVAALPGIDHVELVLEKEAEVATARLMQLCRAERERVIAMRAR